jgi:hypothetical protein
LLSYRVKRLLGLSEGLNPLFPDDFIHLFISYFYGLFLFLLSDRLLHLFPPKSLLILRGTQERPLFNLLLYQWFVLDGIGRISTLVSTIDLNLEGRIQIRREWNKISTSYLLDLLGFQWGRNPPPFNLFIWSHEIIFLECWCGVFSFRVQSFRYLVFFHSLLFPFLETLLVRLRRRHLE